MYIPIPYVLIAILVVAVVLWARGLIKSNQADMIAGWCVLVFMCMVGIIVAQSSAIFPFLGVTLIVFSIATLAAGAFARATCPIRTGSRVALSIGLILLGMVLLLVV
jgi:hypothetical protein